MFEIRFHEFCIGDERIEEGQGWKFVYAFDTRRNPKDVVREWKGDDGNGCVNEGGGYEMLVCGGGEESDGGVTTEEETG